MKESFLRLNGNPIISKISFDLNKAFTPTDFNINVNLKIAKKIVKTETNAKCFLKIVIFEKGDIEPFFLEIEAIGNFEWTSDVNEKELNNVLNYNSPAIILSYLRPFISQITLFSGNPPLILPLINFTDKEIENY